MKAVCVGGMGLWLGVWAGVAAEAPLRLPEGVTLPEGIPAPVAGGPDVGLRLVDLNGDGFDDVLFSNRERYAIHLWSSKVQPHLGWTKGWSQFVRAGARTGAEGEPPALEGATVRLVEGRLEIRRAASGGEPAKVEVLDPRALIAVRMPAPKSPEEARAAFRVRPGFVVELVAAEPLVQDPVSFDWDARGRLWVVEMRDYPLGLDGRGKPGGVVKRLEDTDGDGRMDRAVTFLEGVPFPSSVMPWRDGVLVAAAPDLFLATDTDGDGRADQTRVLFTGFAPGNQQHRFNGFEWGLDGWVYLANGDSGGRVRSVATGREMSIAGRDLRVMPDTGAMETLSGQTQYGLRRDDWGRWYGNNNPTWLWHVTVPERYLRRNPELAVKRVTRVLANYEDSTRVFPASAPQVRPNQPWSLNHVTSGCSPAPYRDDLFGAGFAESVFIGEPVHNTVHREVLEAEGSGLRSRRAAGEERSEFLSSTDPWFRPTTVRTGPDGALWVADMYRFVLEHPEWISPEMLARVNVRAGEDRGRIWRVVPEGAVRRRIPDLASLDVAGLVAALGSVNGWQRDLAHRLLVERGAREAAPALRRLCQPPHAPQVRLQALAVLGTLGDVTSGDVLRAVEDPHPAVRAEAARQAERLAPEDRAAFDAVAGLALDGEASVRLQAAFSLGEWAAELAEPVLRAMAERDAGDEGIQVAIRSSLKPGSALWRELGKESKPVAKKAAGVPKPVAASPDRAAVVERYLGLETVRGDAARGQVQFRALCAPCHRFRGEGTEVGPDLGMVSDKPADWLVTAILDPGAAVEARYRAWNLVLEDGETVSGIVAAETSNNLVLRQAGDAERAILRGRIRSMEVMPGSLMPAGLEASLTREAMADLLAWIRGR